MQRELHRRVTVPEKPHATLSDRQARGGVIGGKGYGFQAAYIVSRIPHWLADPDFVQFLQEGAGDVDVHFNRAEGEDRWYVQVKNYQVDSSKAREVFAQFLETDQGSPGTYTRFTLACPGLHPKLKRLRAAVEELHGAASFYRPGTDPILDNTQIDLEQLVEELNLPVDVAFLVGKVRFETDLAGLTDDVSLCDQFVGALLQLDAWDTVPPNAAVRAYEKLALLSHRAIRQTCSREQMEALIQEAVAKAPVEEGRRFDVPFIRNPDFVGRQEDLERLHQALMGEDPGSDEGDGVVGIRPAGLTGMGGIGKTELAVEYTYRYADSYPGGVFWINATEPLAGGFAQLGRSLHPHVVDRSQHEQIEAAVAYLRQHPDTLLVLDNVQDPTELRRPLGAGLVPAALPCRILFTTRRRDLGQFRPIEVSVLTEGPALQLLLRRPDRRPILRDDHPEHAQARAICRDLGRLPLALELAGAFLGEWLEVSLDDYRTRLREEGCLETLDEEGRELPQGSLREIHDAAVEATLATQWGALSDEVPRLVLRTAGQMGESALIPVARLGLLAGVATEERSGRPSKVARAVRRLANASLVEELKEGRVRLHPLVREFAARQTPDEDTESFRLTCAGNLANSYEDIVVLENHCAQRGIDAVQRDLMVGLEMVASHRISGGGDRVEFLRALLNLARREAHVLRGWEQERRPAFFAQQMRNRIAAKALTSLALGIEERLVELGQPHVRLLWRAGRESTALERTLAGHEAWVSAVAVTPDGSRAISASDDRTLKVWDLETGRETLTLAGHEGAVSAVAVTPDGSRAISASNDRTLKVWDLETGRETLALAGHEGAVSAVAVTPDGSRAISASNDRTLKVWDLETGRETLTLAGHEAWVSAVAVTPDGSRAISGSWDCTLKVWDLETGRETLTLAGHKGAVRAVAVTPDGKRAISASGGSTLKVWNLETGRETRTLAGHGGAVSAVAVTPDGSRAISASDDCTLKVWDLGTGRETLTLAGHEGRVNAVAVTPDGSRAISASNDRTLKVWDLETGQETRTLAGHEAWVSAVAVTPDGKRAISASDDRTLKVWDLETGQETRTLAGHEDRVNAVAVTPDGSRAISASDDRTLKVWDLETGQEIHTLVGHGGAVYAGAVTPDGSRAISASFDWMLKVWDLETGQEIHTLVGHGGAVYAVAVTPDGKRAISASDDRTLKVWDLETGQEIHTLAGHGGSVYAVAVTPDGSRAISASYDRTLEVWDLETGQETHTLSGRELVNAVAVTPDGKRAISASNDRTLKVWDLETGEEIATVVLDGTLACLALAPDGATCVTGDNAGNVYCLRYVGADGHR
jgi:WD40 repeat protein